MKKINYVFLAITLTVIAVSCKKEETITSPPIVTTGLYVLSEGSYGMNNTKLSYYDFSTGSVTPDFYKDVNGDDLGDTGNDEIIYGGKLYIVMNASSYIEVATATTAKSIKKIQMVTGAAVPRQPRFIVGYKGKVLVSSTEGTVAVIDTASLTIDKFITVGSNPEQMVVANDKLYVTNSGGFNFPANYDSTVSVIDLNTFTETEKITVGINPGKIARDNAGHIFVTCTGDYGAIHSTVVSISTATNTVIKTIEMDVNAIRCYGNQLYVYNTYGSPNITVLSTADLSVIRNSFVTDGTAITSAYGLVVDNVSGDIYVTDAKNFVLSGEVFCFDNTGKKKFSFSVAPAVNPNKVVLIQQ